MCRAGVQEPVPADGFITRHEFADGGGYSSGSASQRAQSLVTPRQRSPPVAHELDFLRNRGEKRAVSVRRAGPCLVIALVRHMHEIGPGHHLEQFGGRVRSGADALAGEIDLAGIGFAVGDQLGNLFLPGKDGLATTTKGVMPTRAIGMGALVVELS